MKKTYGILAGLLLLVLLGAPIAHAESTKVTIYVTPEGKALTDEQIASLTGQPVKQQSTGFSWSASRTPKANECYIWKADGKAHFKDLIGYQWTNFKGEQKCLPYRQRGGNRQQQVIA